MALSADQLYAQTIAGYNQQYNTALAAKSKIDTGYNDLYNQQAGYGASQELALNQDYARQLDASQQSMVNRGLGNTTVLDSAARGINYDRANSMLTLKDQLLQRQNAIRQAQFGYDASANSGLSGIQGGQVGYMGTAQQNTQAQAAQASLAAQQNAQQLAAQQALAQQQYGFQRNAAAEGFGYQTQLNNQGYNNQLGTMNQQYQNTRALQNEFGYYARGGFVHPPMRMPLMMPVRGYAAGGGVEQPVGWSGVLVGGGGPPDAAMQAQADAANMKKFGTTDWRSIGFGPLTDPNMGNAPMSNSPAQPNFDFGPQPTYQPKTTAPVGLGQTPPNQPLSYQPPAYAQQQQTLSNQYGFAMGGPVAFSGPVPGEGRGDKVPAMLEPNEFVLSRDMIHALESGYLDKDRLMQMIKQGRATSAIPAAPTGYAKGGAVKKKAAPGAMTMTKHGMMSKGC